MVLEYSDVPTCSLFYHEGGSRSDAYSPTLQVRFPTQLSIFTQHNSIISQFSFCKMFHEETGRFRHVLDLICQYIPRVWMIVGEILRSVDAICELYY